MNILLTGGSGYIGSIAAVELIAKQHSVVIVDNLSNSSSQTIERLQKITGQKIVFYKGDVRDEALLRQIFDENKLDAVMHFAGLKAVGESVMQPLKYYQNNIDSSLSLCSVMAEKGVKKLIFSSSATVYGKPEAVPIKETHPAGMNISSPYGQTKYMIEQILRDLAVADPSWEITCLRYFNPIGAHDSGLIGEDPRDIPNNLMPYICQVAAGKLSKLQVFGNDYDTVDGTGIRDYIHVVDLAKGHIAALEHLAPSNNMQVYNLGTGQGVSVLQLINAFIKASGQKVPYDIVGRRPGDIASCYADTTKAKAELGWSAKKTLSDACSDSWRWQSNNA